jgi:hypothetical protein
MLSSSSYRIFPISCDACALIFSAICARVSSLSVCLLLIRSSPLFHLLSSLYFQQDLPNIALLSRFSALFQAAKGKLSFTINCSDQLKQMWFLGDASSLSRALINLMYAVNAF